MDHLYFVAEMVIDVAPEDENEILRAMHADEL